MKVSVISSCYHSDEQYLRECIEAIINQTFTDWEFILANDGQDKIDMETIVNSYNDPRIKYYDNVNNKGFCESYNNLINMAQGEYFAIAGHDDISTPDRLELLVKELDNDKSLDFASGLVHIFGDARERDDGDPMMPEQVSRELLFYQPMKSGTAMFRKSSWIREGLSFKNIVQVAHDYEMWSRTRHMKHKIINKVLLNYRKHTTNATKTGAYKLRIDHAMIVRRNLQDIGIIAPFGLCQLLDPYAHPTFDEKLKTEYILIFERNKDKLIEVCGEELYNKKLESIKSK